MKDIIAKRKEAERQIRIDTILNAARKLFLENGYLGTSIRDIARESHLSTGAFYFYFADKDEVYGIICEEAGRVFVDHLKKVMDEGTDLKEKIRRMAWSYIDFYRNYPEQFELFVLRGTPFTNSGLSENIASKLAATDYEIDRLLEGMVAEGMERGLIKKGDSTMIATELAAGILGLLLSHKREHFDFDLDEQLECHLEVIFKGIAPD
ncbi:MAG: TetR/AcrR family transcriptional regulator [Actinomycetota bacterium]|nr:TetR/AcrR family transcriptional regulator [Actinomycetota bacterium]